MHEGDGILAKTLRKSRFFFKLTGPAMVQPASSDQWEAPLDYNIVHAQQENLLVLAQTTRKDSIRNQITKRPLIINA